MKISRLSVWSALCLACSLAGAAQAGTVYKTVERAADNGAIQSTTTLSASDGRLLAEQIDTGQSQPKDSMIFKDGGMIAVDHSRKSYVVLDKAALQKLAGGMSQAMKQMEQAMAGMSAEQRAMMEKMMGNKMPGAAKPRQAPLEFRNTGKTEKVGEYTCRLWEVRSGDQLRWQHCVVDFGEITGSEEMFAIMKDMGVMMKELMDAMDTPWLRESMNSGWEGLQSIDGYPVLTRTFRDGKPVSEVVLESAQTAAVPPSSFDPPAGYKRQEMGPG